MSQDKSPAKAAVSKHPNEGTPHSGQGFASSNEPGLVCFFWWWWESLRQLIFR